MTTRIELVNSALRECGANRIESFDGDTFEGKLISDIYDLAVEQTMAQGDWVSLRKRSVLTRLVTPPAFGYKYSYQMPTMYKVLRLLELNDTPVSSKAYQLEGDTLYTDSSNAKIVYIAKVDNVGEWEPTLVAAVKAGLKYSISNAMNAEEGATQRLFQEWIGFVKDGQSISSGQASPRELYIDNYLRCRR